MISNRLSFRRARTRPVFYLVSAAGVPNFGDEFITRAWLDWLNRRHPEADVWLDCIEPGRASHLFAGTHPRLATTNTLWQLAHINSVPDPRANAERAAQSVRMLGTPQMDLGLEMLRTVSSVHLLGGGYLNAVWPANLALVGAVAQLARSFGIRAFATGQGFLPLATEVHGWLRAQLAEFDYVESRDAEGALSLGVKRGVDDAFLAFGSPRPIYTSQDVPDVMVLMQGDFLSGGDAVGTEESLVRFVERFAPHGRFGIAEGLPPVDARFADPLRERFPDAEFYPFMRLWQEGLPMRGGQKWLTSRFHFHLLAAAAGAAGTVVDVRPGYYSVKHRLLLDLGTGWTLADDLGAAEVPEPARNSGFVGEVAVLEREKDAVARSLYG